MIEERIPHSKITWVLPFTLTHFVHHLCTHILPPLLPLIRDAFRLSYFRSGMLSTVLFITYGLSQAPMGKLSGLLSRRMVVSLGLLGVAFFSVMIGISVNYYEMLAFVIAIAIVGGVQHPAVSSLISFYFPRERRGRALGINQVGGSGSFMAGPVLAGLIVGFLSWRAAFVILAIPAIIVGLLFWRMVKTEAVRLRGTLQAGGGAKFETKRILRLLAPIVTLAMLAEYISFGMVSFLSLYMVDKHGVAPAYASMFVGVVYAAGLVGPPIAGYLSDHWGRKPVIIASISAVGPLLYLISVLPYGPGLIVALFLLGLAWTSKLPVLESFVMDSVPAEQRTTVLGFYFTVNQSGGAGGMIIGYAADMLGISRAFTLIALAACGVSVLALLLRKRV